MDDTPAQGLFLRMGSGHHLVPGKDNGTDWHHPCPQTFFGNLDGQPDGLFRSHHNLQNPTRHSEAAPAGDHVNFVQDHWDGLIRDRELREFQVGGRGVWRVGASDLEDYIGQAYAKAARLIEVGELTAEDET
jgi:hypothetical protein